MEELFLLQELPLPFLEQVCIPDQSIAFLLRGRIEELGFLLPEKTRECSGPAPRMRLGQSAELMDRRDFVRRLRDQEHVTLRLQTLHLSSETRRAAAAAAVGRMTTPGMR